MTQTKLDKAWTANGWAERRDLLAKLPKQVIVLLAAEWARSTLHIFEDKYPNDKRPRLAIEAAEKWVAELVTANASTNASYASTNASYAAVNASYAAVNASYAATYAANVATATNASKWKWMRALHRHARGPVFTFDPEWRTDTAVALARGIVAGRAFDRMPILADALQDAGCDDSELMRHLQEDVEEWAASDWVLWNLLGYGEDK